MNKVFFIFVSCLLLAACTATQKGAGIGALAGAGLGAIIGHQSGHTTEGALIGGAAGAVGGGLIGNQMGKTKFCPVCGNQYDENLQYCPKDGALLKTRNAPAETVPAETTPVSEVK